MQETELVMDLFESLERRECNGHATVRMGTALADPAKFRRIFSRFSRGTYYEELELDLEEVDPVISCSCGYRGVPSSAAELSECPRCGGNPELEKGTEFEVVEP